MTAPTDPLYTRQWYLSALTGDASAGTTLIERIWEEFNGAGVNVGVYDSGIEHSHPDLSGNYNPALHVVVNGTTLGGGVTGDESLPGHGTSVAGIIGAERNDRGTVGIAWGSSLTGVNIFDPDSPASTENRVGFSEALHQMANFDVINCRLCEDNLDQFTDTEYEFAATTGRDGLGTVIVQPSGNDNEDVTGRSPSRFTVTVGAVLEDGSVFSNSSSGASLLVSAPGGDWTILTTDMVGANGFGGGDYAQFGGTSAAAPMVSGAVALMLQANPDLGWRDVNDILATTASHTGSALGAPADAGEENAWFINAAENWNGGGMHFSADYGYGSVNVFAAVRMAEAYGVIGIAPQTSANEVQASATGAPNLAIGDLAAVSYDIDLADGILIDQVDLTLTLTHESVADLDVWLVSPDGTEVQIGDNSIAGTKPGARGSWTFGIEALRGENSDGTWTIRIEDNLAGGSGVLESVRIDAYGKAAPESDDVFTFTDEFRETLSFDPSRNLLADTDGGGDWINAAVLSGDAIVNLNPDAYSRIDGALFRIAAGSVIENAMTGDGADRLIGNSADNKLNGMRGVDSLAGGDGLDTLEGGTGADVLQGGRGRDAASYMHAKTGVTASLTDPSENRGEAKGDSYSKIENLIGSRFQDRLFGDAIANQLFGHGRTDTIVGRGGNDALDGGGGDDSMLGGGNDDRLLGAEGNDRLFGENGIDRLFGENGGDRLDGGAGDDWLTGGLGADWMIGGAGADRFEFNAIDESATAIGIDRIIDFQQRADLIDLSTIDANVGIRGNQAFAFIEGDGFTAVGQVRVVQADSYTLVYLNNESDASSRENDSTIFLSGDITLTADDFIL
ncbi:MAG: S8 family serine peptidase [Rhizobiales bacterium]|nr:S8 family serine peptidase [Hyphomicrobiales bacterium]